VSAYVSSGVVGSDLLAFFTIQDTSVSAKSAYAASLTLSSADDQLVLAEMLRGSDTFTLSAFADKAYGLAGNDTMFGNDGNDTLVGGAGIDSLSGRNGNDTFVFNATSETYNSKTISDVITDCTRAEYVSNTWVRNDQIDLQTIDANSAISGNNSFVFKGAWISGSSPFGTSSAGEVTLKQFNNSGTANDYTLVYINTNSTVSSEAIIKLVGLVDLTANDFIL
jgi:serralysin